MKHEACFGQHLSTYGVATVNRIDQIIGLFCRILSLLQGSFARETFNLFDPTNQSHPIGLFCGRIRGLEWTNMGFVCRDIYEYSSLLRKYKGFEWIKYDSLIDNTCAMTRWYVLRVPWLVNTQHMCRDSSIHNAIRAWLIVRQHMCHDNTCDMTRWYTTHMPMTCWHTIYMPWLVNKQHMCHDSLISSRPVASTHISFCIVKFFLCSVYTQRRKKK